MSKKPRSFYLVNPLTPTHNVGYRDYFFEFWIQKCLCFFFPEQLQLSISHTFNASLYVLTMYEALVHLSVIGQLLLMNAGSILIHLLDHSVIYQHFPIGVNKGSKAEHNWKLILRVQVRPTLYVKCHETTPDRHYINKNQLNF